MLVLASHAGLGQIVPGGLGVTVFFFLSGYLITTLLFSEYDRNQVIDVWRFYARRVFRIVPPLIVTLVIAYGLVYLTLLPPITFRFSTLLSQLFYFANYDYIFFNGDGSIPGGTGILWSLAVEEHFYIFYPFLLTIVLRLNGWPNRLFVLLLLLCVFALLWRVYLVANGASEIRTYYASDTRIDSIIYGCVLATWLRIELMKSPVRNVSNMTTAQWLLFVSAVGCLVFTGIYRDPFFRESFRYSIQGIALLPIFYFAVTRPNNLVFKRLNSRWIVKIGVYSYFIYLIHFVVISAILYSTPSAFQTPVLLIAASLAISIAYAAIIDRYVDPYFRYLRSTFRPGGPRGARAVVGAPDSSVANQA